MAKQTRLRTQQGGKRRLAILLVIFLVGGGVVSWKLTDSSYFLQKFRAFFSAGKRATIQNGVVRGTIYDRNYKEIAVSLERVSVFARLRELEAVDGTALRLAAVLEADADYLKGQMSGASMRSWLAKNITQEQEDAVRSLALPGIYLHREFSRYYPEDGTAAHLIGFVEDDIGLAGVEYYYDRLARRQVTGDKDGKYPGSIGQDVLLSIDLKIQKILEEVVKDLSRGREGVRIGAYAMDAGTGALVSAVQLPSFNPNTYKLYSKDALTSMLLQPMLLPHKFRMLLRDGANIQNEYESRGKVYPWSVSGEVRSLGGELRLWDRLGFTRSLPVDFAIDESRPLETARYYYLQGEEAWEYGTVPETLRPLQLLAGLSGLVNGGTVVVPYVVEKLVDPESGEEYQLSHTTRQDLTMEAVSAEVSREISRLLEQQASKGGLGSATLVDTIQSIAVSADGNELVGNQLVFTAIPVGNAELTILVTLQGAIQGMALSDEKSTRDPAAVVQEVLPRIAVLQQVGKSVSDVVEPAERGNGNYPVGLEEINRKIGMLASRSVPEAKEQGKMPKLIGLSLRKSLRLLQGKKCEIRIYGTGKVVRQEPSAGYELESVADCILTLQPNEEVSLKKLEEKIAD